MAPLIAGVFQTRGATALVFRGDDGIDKLTTTGHSCPASAGFSMSWLTFTIIRCVQFSKGLA